MRSFGAIFVTLALAFSASAASIYPRDAGNSLDGLGGLAGAVGQVPDVDVHHRQLPNANGLTSEVTKDANVVVPRDHESSYPAIVSACTGQIQGLVVELNAALHGEVEVDAVVTVLTKIKVVLVVAVANIRKLVDTGAQDILVLNGKVQAAADIAALISALVHVCVGAVVAVLDIKVLVSASAVIKICTAISVQLAVIVTFGASLVKDLVADIVPLVADISAGLHLKVCAAIATALNI